MKTKVLCSFMFTAFIGLVSSAQNSPYFNYSSQWYWSGGYFWWGGSGTYDQVHYVDGDTLITGNLYFQVYADLQDSSWTNSFDSLGNPITVLTTVDSSKHNYRMTIREDSGRVYRYKVFDSTEVLLFDYNLHLSDSITSCYGAVVTSIDSVAFAGFYRYVFELDSGSKGIVIEGVGSHWGLGVDCPTAIGIEGGNYLQCYSMNGTTISPKLDTACQFPVVVAISRIKDQAMHPAKLFPNPFSYHATITFDNKYNQKYTLTLYDCLGNLVNTIPKISTGKVGIKRNNLKSGIYFYQLISEAGNLNFTGKLIIE